MINFILSYVFDPNIFLSTDYIVDHLLHFFFLFLMLVSGFEMTYLSLADKLIPPAFCIFALWLRAMYPFIFFLTCVTASIPVFGLFIPTFLAKADRNTLNQWNGGEDVLPIIFIVWLVLTFIWVTG